MGNASRLGLNVILSLSPTTNNTCPSYNLQTQHNTHGLSQTVLAYLVFYNFITSTLDLFLFSLSLLVNSYRIGERIYSNFKPKLYTLGQFDILLFFLFLFSFLLNTEILLNRRQKGLVSLPGLKHNIEGMRESALQQKARFYRVANLTIK
jgi:hypothetical protein